MKSIIVSDPDQQNLTLLAIINMAAIARKSRDLIQLTPMPLYQGKITLRPILDYRAAILDQEAGTFTVVEPSELTGCLNDYCVTSNPETNVATESCGIPQLQDRHIKICNFEEITSNGIFLKRMQLDGIVFNMREEVTAQIFCDGRTSSEAHKIKNSGIVNLPPGCSLSVTDHDGRISRIKSLPSSQMVELPPVDLIIAGPEEIFKQIGPGRANETSGLTKIINAHLDSLNTQLSITNETVHSYRTYISILAGLLTLTIILCFIIGAFLYLYSTRFRNKVRIVRQEIREGIDLTSEKFHKMEAKVRERLTNELTRTSPRTVVRAPAMPR